jgi:outer membrane receptor protein involved in Fe transport
MSRTALLLILLPVIVTAVEFDETVVRSHMEQERSVYESRTLQMSNLMLPGDGLDSALTSSGAEIVGRTSPGALSTVSLRGGTAVQSLVTIGSVPVNPVQNGTFDLSLFPAGIFSSVEIVQGGCSSVRGANAASGHLGLTLPSIPERHHVDAAILSGSGQRFEGSAGLGLRFSPGFGGRIFASAHASRNAFSYRTNEESGITFTRKNAANTNISLYAAGYFRSRLVASDLHLLMGEKRTGAPGQSPTSQDTNARQKDRSLFILSHNVFHLPLFTELDLSWYASEMVFKDPDAFGPPLSVHTNYQSFARLGQTYDGDSWSLHYGLEGRWNTVRSTVIGLKERGLLSPFASLDVTPSEPDVKWSLRGRCDWSTVRKPVVTGTAGVRESLGAGITTRASLSASFREPGFNDLYWPNDGWSVGNPNLRPERSYNLDAGIEHAFKDLWSAQVTGFLTSYEDLIIWPEVSPWFWSPRNVDQAFYMGVDASAELRPLRNLDLTARYSHVRPYNATPGSFKGKFIPYIPLNRWGATASYSWHGLGAFVRYAFTGESFKTQSNSKAAEDIAKSSSSLDAGISAEWKGLTLGISCLDLLRPWSFTPYGQPVMGRRFNVELKYGLDFGGKTEG